MKKLLVNGSIILLFIAVAGTQIAGGMKKGRIMSPPATLSVHRLAHDSIPWSTNKGRKSLEQRKKRDTLNADSISVRKDTATWNNQQKNWQQKSNWKHKKSKMPHDSMYHDKKPF